MHVRFYDPADPYKNLAAAAEYLAVSESHFRGMVKDGLMPEPTRLGSLQRWSRASLDRAIKKLRRKAKRKKRP